MQRKCPDCNVRVEFFLHFKTMPSSLTLAVHKPECSAPRLEAFQNWQARKVVKNLHTNTRSKSHQNEACQSPVSTNAIASLEVQLFGSLGLEPKWGPQPWDFCVGAFSAISESLQFTEQNAYFSQLATMNWDASLLSSH